MWWPCRPLIFLACLMLLALPLIGGTAPPDWATVLEGRRHAGPAPMRVMATTGMIGDVVARVGGERVRVDVLMAPGTDPHVYTPRRADLVRLQSADVIIHHGLGLEGKLASALAGQSRRALVVGIADRVAALYPVEGHAAGAPDPHLWMDVAAWTIVADELAAMLVAFDPAGAAVYTANITTYRAELKAVDDYARETLARIPAERRLLVTAHDAFFYLGRAYGIEVMGVQGLSTESEAGLADIRRLADVLVARRVPAVFVESTVPDKNVRALVEGARARGHEVRLGGTLYSDAMGPAGTYEGTYLGMIDHNVTTIARALGATVPERGLNGRLRAGNE